MLHSPKILCFFAAQFHHATTGPRTFLQAIKGTRKFSPCYWTVLKVIKWPRVFLEAKCRKTKTKLKKWDNTYCQHPGCILYFTGIRLDITVIECAASVHVYLVVIPKMGNQERNIPNNSTLRSSIWTVVWSEVTLSLMLEFTVVRKDFWASQGAIFTRKFKRLSHLLQC